LGGAHRRYGIDPDVAVFAKAISNGYPMGAVIGREKVMQAAQRSFISSTYWTEGIGPTAALATIRKMTTFDLPKHVERVGSNLRRQWLELGEHYDIPVKATGHAALLSLGFEHPQALALSTLVTQRLLADGILFSGGFYPSLAHEARHVDRLATALHPVFEEVRTAIRCQDILERVGGAEFVRHAGFDRLT
jgi:glutamate-1-semialdehyde 2,1-aminomutase